MKIIGKITVLAAVILALSGIIYFYFSQKRINPADVAADTGGDIMAAAPLKKDRIESIAIADGATYGELMKTASTSHETAMAIYEAARGFYDLVKIRAGRTIELTFDGKTDELKRFNYKIDTEDELFVAYACAAAPPSPAASSTDDAEVCAWRAEVKPIPYETRTKTAGGEVETSMYEAALENKIDIRAVIELADAFQWTIDFAMDPRAGDTFRFVYEERYLDGEYVMPGRILAGRYTNDGTVHEVYYFEEAAANSGFFDAGGNSVQKMFLKAPVAFKYISSGFTTGARYIEAFDISTGHRAIDYAAPAGTPIRAVGDGTVVSAGWGGSYGYKTTVRHNGTYATNYCHQSKIAVSKGQKVKQGEVIGYVGSTGLSTGPHLHYEMVKNGAKVNPLREVLPPGAPIKEENKGRFAAEIARWRALLDE